MAPANPFNRAKKYHLASHWGMFVPTLFRAYLALVAFFTLTKISFAAFSKGIFARNYSDKAYISNIFPWKKMCRRLCSSCIKTTPAWFHWNSSNYFSYFRQKRIIKVWHILAHAHNNRIFLCHLLFTAGCSKLVNTLDFFFAIYSICNIGYACVVVVMFLLMIQASSKQASSDLIWWCCQCRWCGVAHQLILQEWSRHYRQQMPLFPCVSGKLCAKLRASKVMGIWDLRFESDNPQLEINDEF